MASALEGILEPTLAGMGYELVDTQVSNRGRFLRIFMDKPGGITIDDCAAATRHLQRVFAVEGIEYDRLEISSPGLDRPLKKEADYSRFAGRLARLSSYEPVDGRRHWTGRLVGVADGVVTLSLTKEGGLECRIPLAKIAHARLEVEFPRGR